MSTSYQTTQKVKALHVKVKKLLEDGSSDAEIIAILEKEGLDAYYAKTIIENLEADKEDKKNFRNSMIMGGFYILAGLLVNYFSYKNGTVFILFWGIVVFGIVTIIRGFILYK